MKQRIIGIAALAASAVLASIAAHGGGDITAILFLLPIGARLTFGKHIED